MNAEKFISYSNGNAKNINNLSSPNKHLIDFEVLSCISSMILIATMSVLMVLVVRDEIPAQIQEQSYNLLYNTLKLIIVALVCSFGAFIITTMRIFFVPIIKALFKKDSSKIKIHLKAVYSYLKKAEQTIIRPYDPDVILTLASFIILAVAICLFADKGLKII